MPKRMRTRKTKRTRKGRKFTRKQTKMIRRIALVADQAKYYATDNSTAQIVSTGNVTCAPLTPLLSPGVFRNQHNGNRILLKKFHINMQFTPGAVAATGGGVSTIMRVMLILDKDGNGQFPPTTPLATNPALPVAPITVATDWLLIKTSAQSYRSPIDPSTVGRGKRYTILKDKMFTLDVEGGQFDVPHYRIIKFRKAWKNYLKVTYNDNGTAGYDSVLNNMVYLVIYTSSALATAALGAPSYVYTVETWFQDA